MASIVSRGSMDSGKQTEGFRGEGSGGMVSLATGIKEGTDGNEHWVLYANHKSLNTMPTTNDVLYSDYII